MYRFRRKFSIRRRILGIAMIGMGAAAVVSGSCFFEPRTKLCESTGVRCPQDWFCTADQDACTQDGCGDGILTGGEACDDGNKRDGDGCSPSCTTEECGNGTIEQGETCDDGEIVSGDGCNEICAVETCGNKILDLGEECDTGTADTEGCNFPTQNALAAIRCTFVKCGDDHVNGAAGEMCDTGGVVTPSCNIRCKTPVCGDGFYDPMSNEDCDSGGKDTLACNVNCKAPRCGDGHKNSAYYPPGSQEPEECDTGGDHPNCNGGSPPGIGNCRAPRCGDAYLNKSYVPPGSNTVEECDDGSRNDNDKPDACRENCRTAYCGDGVVDRRGPGEHDDEQCDAGVNNSDSNPDACRTSCREAFCGDGVQDGGEACDPGGANGNPPPQGTCPALTRCAPAGQANQCTCEDLP